MNQQRLRRFTCAIPIAAALLAVACTGMADDSSRDHYLQPERVLDAAGVRAGMVVGEVGAGRGYFTVKLARRVGVSGEVYANDIDKDALDELNQRCIDEGIANVTTVLGEVDDPRLPERSLDVVFIVYALHHFDLPVEVLTNLAPSLKPGGTVVVLDQDPELSDNHHFLTRARVEEVFTQAEYEPVGCGDFLERDLLCVFRPLSRLSGS